MIAWLNDFTSPLHRFYFGYLFSAVLISLLFFIVTRQKITLKATIAYWLHPSAKIDYIYYILIVFFKLYLLLPLTLSAKSVMVWTHQSCLSLWGYQPALGTSAHQVILLYTLTLFIASDFSRYWLHRALHAIPWLWVFHKVHHSAEVLNPVTFYRVHPVESLLFGLRYALVIGFVTGIFVYLFGAKVGLYEILGANALLFIFNLLGSNLRHSHIELRYPHSIEKWLISPRQHQIHHMQMSTRYNYGGYLAIWDRLFHTLQPSKTLQPSPYGLGEKQNQRYHHVYTLLTTPFIELLTQRKP